MGFFDALFGRTKIPAGKTDQIFAIATAAIDIETKLNTPFSGRAGIILRSVDNSSYEAIQRDLDDILKMSGQDMPVTAHMQADGLGFTWIIFEGTAIDGVINALHLSADMVKQAGYSDTLLAALFGFAGWYLVYSYRRATFYPFVPQGTRKRDASREFRLASTLKPSLPMEQDTDRWYPIWDVPFS